jgi:hypothetical protein
MIHERTPLSDAAACSLLPDSFEAGRNTALRFAKLFGQAVPAALPERDAIHEMLMQGPRQWRCASMPS